MHQLTLADAAARGEQGMSNAADRANRAIAEWTVLAFEALCAVVRSQPTDRVFIVEELRASIATLPEPTDLRAWGQVTQRALRAGVIVATGSFKRAMSSNASPKPCYRKGRAA